MPKSKRPSPIASRSRAAAGCRLWSVVATHGRRALAPAPATRSDGRRCAPVAVMSVVVAVDPPIVRIEKLRRNLLIVPTVGGPGRRGAGPPLGAVRGDAVRLAGLPPLEAPSEASRRCDRARRPRRYQHSLFWEKEGAPTPPVRECAAPASSWNSSAPTSSNSQPPIGGLLAQSPCFLRRYMQTSEGGCDLAEADVLVPRDGSHRVLDAMRREKWDGRLECRPSLPPPPERGRYDLQDANSSLRGSFQLLAQTKCQSLRSGAAPFANVMVSCDVPPL